MHWLLRVPLPHDIKWGCCSHAASGGCRPGTIRGDFTCARRSRRCACRTWNTSARRRDGEGRAHGDCKGRLGKSSRKGRGGTAQGYWKALPGTWSRSGRTAGSPWHGTCCRHPCCGGSRARSCGKDCRAGTAQMVRPAWQGTMHPCKSGLHMSGPQAAFPELPRLSGALTQGTGSRYGSAHSLRPGQGAVEEPGQGPPRGDAAEALLRLLISAVQLAPMHWPGPASPFSPSLQVASGSGAARGTGAGASRMELAVRRGGARRRDCIGIRESAAHSIGLNSGTHA